MFYLVHYDRMRGALVSIREFRESERIEASAAKLALEIDLLSRPNGDEVVLLEADSESDLRKTHRRYFDSFDEMKSGKDSEARHK